MSLAKKARKNKLWLSINCGSTGLVYKITSSQEFKRHQTYTYDAAGNLTADETFTYTYDARGRLVQVTTGGVTTSYAINGLGQRVSKSSSSTTTIFVYDEASHLLGEYDATGNVIQETVWLGDLPVAVLKPGAQYYVNPDHLGSPKSIIDSSGATVWRWDKDPFGNGAPTGTLTYNLRFPGQYFDVETGLCYNMARDYNPALGRYIQSDPIGLRGGVNTYVYVENDPVSRVDPLGLDSYGTTDCSYYEKQCKKYGCDYYCNWAPKYCKKFNQLDGLAWTRCVRKCLQDYDCQNCQPKEQSCPDCSGVFSCNWVGHFHCYSVCLVVQHY
ncbi:MAG: hypothetical protein HQK56_14915 [Deltaproteobacteria bacterium]|nr:hypothetical protein [Deltaproteobacteria bacterium]